MEKQVLIPVCPKCNKSYGVNVRKDGTIRCRLCGYEGARKQSTGA